MMWRIALAAVLTLCLAVIGSQPRAQFNGCSAGFCSNAAASGGGTGPVTFDAKSTVDTNADGVTTITHSNLTVGAGATAISGYLTFSNVVPSGLSVVWDSGASNQTLSAVPTASIANGTAISCALYAFVGSVTAGNKSLVVSWSGSRNIRFAAASWKGNTTASVAAAFPHGTTSTSASPTAVTITSATNHQVTAAFGTPGSITSVDNNAIYFDQLGAIAGAANYANGAASVSLSASPSNTTPVGCGSDISF
jgi:hypothetical protein